MENNNKLLEDLDKYKSGGSKKAYLWISLLIVVSVLGIYFYMFSAKSSTSNIEYTSSKVTKGDLEVVVSATGNLNPTNSVEIGIEVSGTIKEIYVDFNDEVKVGQVLAKLDTVKLQSQVDSSSAALAIAKASEKESATNLNNKKLVYDRTKKMFDSSNGKYPSKNELDDTRFAYEAAVSSLEGARARVMQSMSNLNTDKQNLEKAHVKSSIDGIVLNREVEIGQTLAATMSAPKLFTLAKDLTKMDLIVSIDEADVADIKQGLDVSFTVDAYANKTFKGKIKQVRLNPITVNGVVTYETVVEVDNQDLLLKPGMTANAKIVTKQSLDHLLIPNSALRFKPKTIDVNKSAPKGPLSGPNFSKGNNGVKDLSKKDFASVYVLENSKAKMINVKVIDTDGKSSAIEPGELKEGDGVITAQRSSDAK